jgi:hypothetical protein
MNRIAQQQQQGRQSHGIAFAIGRYLIGAAGLGALLAMSVAGCALETASEGDSSSAAAAGGDKTTVGTPAPGALPPAVRASTPNSQPGALRGAAPAGGPGGGEDPQPSPWIGTDNAAQGSPIDRQQLGASVEHK